MAYENNNRGSVWRNERKEKDTHPDFTGQAKIDGVEFWVSAWKRKPDAKPNAPALSFSVKPKEERQQEPQHQPEQPAGGDFDDDIPFMRHESGSIV